MEKTSCSLLHKPLYKWRYVLKGDRVQRTLHKRLLWSGRNQLFSSHHWSILDLWPVTPLKETKQKWTFCLFEGWGKELQNWWKRYKELNNGNIRKYTYLNESESCSVLSDSLVDLVQGILQAKILEWVAFPFSRGSSQPRDRTQVSHIAGRFFTSWAPREAHQNELGHK